MRVPPPNAGGALRPAPLNWSGIVYRGLQIATGPDRGAGRRRSDLAMTRGESSEVRREFSESTFHDVDALAAAARDWDQEYDQLGRGSFRGRLTQLLLGGAQLGVESWSPGVLQRGAAPNETWVFALPLRVTGSLHVRRRQIRGRELLVASPRDDFVLSATGAAELLTVVLPTRVVQCWMRARRHRDDLSCGMGPDGWRADPSEMARRAVSLSRLLEDLVAVPDMEVTGGLIERARAQIADAVLDIIPTAEAVEPLPARAQIARKVMDLLVEHRADPPAITELCALTGARERTLHLACVEAFGRPPARLLLEMRLGAVRRALMHPMAETSVTRAASRYGFAHFGRFSATYERQFGELPSSTLAAACGTKEDSQLIQRGR